MIYKKNYRNKGKKLDLWDRLEIKRASPSFGRVKELGGTRQISSINALSVCANTKNYRLLGGYSVGNHKNQIAATCTLYESVQPVQNENQVKFLM